MEKFIEDVIISLEAVNDLKLKSDNQWTVALKKALIDVADNYGLLSNCSNIGGQYKKNHTDYEWLYDIILYSNKEENILDKVYLAGESEWSYNRGNLENDFSKLLPVRAKVRLMVYQVRNENEYNELRNRFIRMIEESSSAIKDDMYLFAVYFHYKNEFKVEEYTKK